MSQKYKVTVDSELEEIMPRYIEIRLNELEELEKYLAEKNAEAVRMLGHRLKGTGASYGIEELTDIGAAIEDIAKTGSFAGIAEHTKRLRYILENIEIEYEDM
ncbi:Hpt domain-containing protein [Maridesulfovibrio bastinii]|uniref:Hpt domain-containing protein n=1 Tax=Maridesulfovibrio bastinii TaxID=47157 RepID=UPI00042447BD|nr:Hpt domain-containing protein [Maridesulfovibrio bastinii]